MSNTLDSLQSIYQKNREKALEDYMTFLKFESVSSEPAYKEQVNACADWLVDLLKKMGFIVELWPTSGHPTIFASYLKAGPDKPTLLIYNHYDVQPVDPLDEWETPPFEPTIRNNQVYARGAQDNKGQCFYVIQALRTLLERDGTLPINVKLCIEGEEEMGSVGLAGIIEQRKEELKADYLAVVDLGIKSIDQPAITLGVRGIVTMDVTLEGSSHDLHSGSHGGVVYNPIHALVQILSSARMPNGKISIPGFYDDVLALSDEDKENISFHFDEKKHIQEIGFKPTGGETAEFAPPMRSTIRPTFEINGITGGYSGNGFKTVIPAKASAKVSCRLVPDQKPEKIAALVRDYLLSKAPEGVTVQVEIHEGSGAPVRADMNSQIAKAFQQAYSEVFDKPCKAILSGGSIPVISEMARILETQVIFMGLGLSTDLTHAPNEHFGLDRIDKGVLIIARTLELMGKPE